MGKKKAVSGKKATASASQPTHSQSAHTQSTHSQPIHSQPAQDPWEFKVHKLHAYLKKTIRVHKTDSERCVCINCTENTKSPNAN